jgi:hypothetical protein
LINPCPFLKKGRALKIRNFEVETKKRKDFYGMRRGMQGGLPHPESSTASRNQKPSHPLDGRA